jgi:hypothetical protein
MSCFCLQSGIANQSLYKHWFVNISVKASMTATFLATLGDVTQILLVYLCFFVYGLKATAPVTSISPKRLQLNEQ